MKTVIVGGVAGGASAAARLRRLDESAEIVMFERGEYISFANCGLPYYVGGVITDREELTLQPVGWKLLHRRAQPRREQPLREAPHPGTGRHHHLDYQAGHTDL